MFFHAVCIESPDMERYKDRSIWNTKCGFALTFEREDETQLLRLCGISWEAWALERSIWEMTWLNLMKYMLARVARYDGAIIDLLCSYDRSAEVSKDGHTIVTIILYQSCKVYHLNCFNLFSSLRF